MKTTIRGSIFIALVTLVIMGFAWPAGAMDEINCTSVVDDPDSVAQLIKDVVIKNSSTRVVIDPGYSVHFLEEKALILYAVTGLQNHMARTWIHGFECDYQTGKIVDNVSYVRKGRYYFPKRIYR